MRTTGAGGETNPSARATVAQNRGTHPTTLAEDTGLVIVSNRQPYRHRYDESGSIAVDRPTGGLTAAIDPVLQHVGGTWVAWGDGDADRDVVDEDACVSVPPSDPAYTLSRIWLDEDEVDAYYRGFSNRVLWPLCHGFDDVVDHRPGDFETYRRVNERVADRVIEHIDGETLVWLQDYHFALTPRWIGPSTPDSATVGHFWHIPWPTPETFDRCPRGTALLEGLLGNDLLCFHLDRYVDRFLACADRLPATTVDREERTVSSRGHRTHVTATPIGIDADRHAQLSRSFDDPADDPAPIQGSVQFGRSGRSGAVEGTGQTGADVDEILGRLDELGLAVARETYLGLGVDRLDYTKGILERLRGIERCFERYPDLLERFTFVQAATPSRTGIEAYASYGEDVRRAVDRVNDRFGTDEWQPIVYSEDHIPLKTLCGLYRIADFLLVTSHSDGMNLVAKEYVAASVNDTGALCLSPGAGVHDQLGDVAFTVEPTDADDIAATIADVIGTPQAEKRRRMRICRHRVLQYDIQWWMERQFEQLSIVGADRRLSASSSVPGDRS